MLEKEIKLIALDLDGTLLKEDKTIDKSTLEKLNELGKKGVHIVPITGRPLSGIDSVVRGINGTDYLISSNGAYIVENATNDTVYSSKMSKETVLEILNALSNFDCIYEVFSEHYGYCESNAFEYFKATYSGTPLGDYIFSSRRMIPSLFEYFSRDNASADEVFIIAKNEAQRDEMYSSLSSINSIDFIHLVDRFLEITNKGTDKATALKLLCQKLGVKMENTLAFGDGENDLKFLKCAGVSVAMGNARDTVKNNADLVTYSNEENGVLHILNMI